ACQGHDGLSLAVPTYLSLAQVNKLVGLAEKAKLKVRGTATTPLALAAERATHYLYGQREDPSESARPGRSISTTSVLIVDADRRPPLRGRGATHRDRRPAAPQRAAMAGAVARRAFGPVRAPLPPRPAGQRRSGTDAVRPDRGRHRPGPHRAAGIDQRPLHA